jgi:plasmid stabilization system protein ParE
MRLEWTGRASHDLTRVRDFLIPVNPAAALRTVQALRTATQRLTDHPRVGRPVERYWPREVRRWIVGQYEIHYEVGETTILILRLWHTREDR